MGTIIIIAVLIVIVAAAVISSKKHFKGEGGCCGGGSDSVPSQDKKLTEPKIGEKHVYIEGMHCNNCKNSIENAINKYDGVTCHVFLKKKMAVVEYSTEISDDKIRNAIEFLDFKVTKIETVND